MKNIFSKIKTCCAQNRAATIALAVCFFTLIVVVSLTSIMVPNAKLTQIAIERLPDKTQYVEHETLDTTGLIVKAYYGKDSVEITEYAVDKTVLNIEDKQVTVSYKDRGITATAAFPITVNPRSVTSLEAVSLPTKIDYLEGALFDTSGLVVMAYYDNGESEIVQDFTYDIKLPLTVDDKSVHVSYGGQSLAIDITVNPKLLKSILASKLPQKVAYTAGEYFDFYGLEVYAVYENDFMELVKGWDYDKKAPLKTSDNTVTVSYTLHEITRTLDLSISVIEGQAVSDEQQQINAVMTLLQPVDGLTADTFASIEYALSLLNKSSELTPEQSEFREALTHKKQELEDGLPPVPEAEYSITYSIANELIWDDIDYGNNPSRYKNSDGDVPLAAASSQTADELGYVFNGWLLAGQPITSLAGLQADSVVYAEFVMSATADIVFKEYTSGVELFSVQNEQRTDTYDFKAHNIASAIYGTHAMVPVAYYLSNGERSTFADLRFGKTVTVYVVLSSVREVHLSAGDSATVGWRYEFERDGGYEQAVETPSVGTVFTIPVGATVTILSTNANVSDILVDGVSKGEKFNNTVVQAVFELTSGEYPASVTFKTIVSDMTTLSFIGYNSHSIVYQPGWDGYIAEVDRQTVAFVYDEANVNYLVTYTINGVEYLFDDLTSYKFDGDTQIWVTRVRNSFSVTVYYDGGAEKMDDLIGKQTLQEALSVFDQDVWKTMSEILADDHIYEDVDLTKRIPAETLLSDILRGNITVYSTWKPIAQTGPEDPVLEPVDYMGCDFVNTWTAVFMYDGDILSSELLLAANGEYTYKSFLNGNKSTDLTGLYRIENNAVVLKTLTVQDSEYALVTVEDMDIDIQFAGDGLLRANCIHLRGTHKTVFSHTLTCGPVRTVKYTDRNFIGTYEHDGVSIELRENGTAVVAFNEIVRTAYYRVTEDGRLFVFDNGVFGTGEIAGLPGGDKD